MPLTVAAAAQDTGTRARPRRTTASRSSLQKMGWTPGRGIGASGNQGRVIAVDALREGARAARDRTGVVGRVEAELAPRIEGEKKRRRSNSLVRGLSSYSSRRWCLASEGFHS